MEDNKNIKKSSNIPVLIALIAVIITATLWAYSKYQTVSKGNPQTTIAHWDINFSANQTKYSYDYVTPFKIAPGTAGQIDIQMDGTSDTAFEYMVRLSSIKGKPKNLKFYAIKINDEEGELTNGEDIEANRLYFEDINNLRIDANGVVDPSTGSTTANTSVIRNSHLGDMAIEAEDAEVYQSEYKKEGRKLEIHWVWPYNQGDGNSVLNGVVSHNEFNYVPTTAISDYDQDDTDDSEIETMSFTVTIVATQKRAEAKEPVMLKLAGGETVAVTNHEEAKQYYGCEIENYDKGGTYRLFYIDFENKYGDGEGTIYLKADYNPSNKPPQEGLSKISEPTEEFLKLNPKWVEEKGSKPVVRNGEKAAFWLADPNQDEWKSFIDEDLEEYINYVIGSPSVEMLIDSYNKKNNTNWDTRCLSTSGSDSYTGYQYKTTGDYSYNIAGIRDFLSEDNKMYYAANVRTWLCSPSRWEPGYLCVLFDQSLNFAILTRSDVGYCPLVSLKKNTPLQLK